MEPIIEDAALQGLEIYKDDNEFRKTSKIYNLLSKPALEAEDASFRLLILENNAL